MKRAPWPLRVLALMFLMFCGCRTSSRAEITTSSTQQIETHAATQQESVTTVTQGPERTTTTIDEFSPQSVAPEPQQGPDKPSNDKSTAKGQDRGVSNAHGPLLRRTIVVQERGPVVSNTVSSATASTASTQTAKSDSKSVSEHKAAPAVGCTFGLGTGFVVALCVTAGLALLVRFRKMIPGWPGWL